MVSYIDDKTIYVQYPPRERAHHQLRTWQDLNKNQSNHHVASWSVKRHYYISLSCTNTLSIHYSIDKWI